MIRGVCLVVKNKKKKFKVKHFIIKNKVKLISLVLFLFDVFLIMYVGRKNVANYALVNGEEMFVGKTRNLLFGRNYITIVVSLFIYIYGLIINKFIIKHKFSVKKLILIFGLILAFNMIMFYLFTKKVY